MENGHAVGRQAFGRDTQRIFALLDQATFHAVCDVRQLHATVADRRAAIAMQDMRLFAHLPGDLDLVVHQQSTKAGLVGDDLDLGRDVAVALDQAADGGREAGREAPGGQHRDFLLGHHSSSGLHRARCRLLQVANGCDRR